MKINAFKCDECGELVEKADNVLKVGKEGLIPQENGPFNKYQLEIRFFKIRMIDRVRAENSNNEDLGKAVDLCENCKKFISGAGQIDQKYWDKQLPVTQGNSD